MKFTETRKNIWESDVQAYTAAAFNENREPVGEKEAAYKIEKTTNKKDQEVYRLFKAHLGGYTWIKNFKTLDKAIKFVG